LDKKILQFDTAYSIFQIVNKVSVTLKLPEDCHFSQFEALTDILFIKNKIYTKFFGDNLNEKKNTT
jgi:hypothetical protein